jgi:tetratricopeptide (TPR) repeat protein
MGLTSPAQRDYYVLRSDMYSMSGDWLKAQLDLENALKIESSGELQLRHALILAQRGQFDLAEVELRDLVLLPEMEKNIEAHLAYGEVLALQNKAQESLKAYKKALSLDYKNYKAIIFLGAIYSQLKDYNLARNYFARLKGIEDYKHLSGYYLGRLDQQLEKFKSSEKYFEECLAIKPDFTDCIFSLVESLTFQKKIKQAIAKLDSFVEINPDSDRAFAKLYDLHLEEGNQDLAFRQLVQLERFEPQNRFIKMQMALHLVEQNQNEMAIQKLNEIAELSPSFGKTYFLLSTIYERQGDDKKAQYYYNKIEKNQPIYIEASIQRAKDIEHKSGLQSALSFLKKVDNSGSDTRVYLYISILQNKMGYKDQSIKTLRSVVLKNPNDVQILYFLGHLEGESGEMGRAILNMKRVIQLDPTHSDALNYLAFYYAENNILLDEAEKLVQKALEIKPDDGHYQDTMGWIYFHKGQFELAQKFLEKAYNSHPEEPVIAEHLAAVYSVKGLKDKARRVYTNLIEKGIGDSEKIKRQINSITSQK